MKLTYFQLEPHLNKHLLLSYVVSGDEPLQIQDAASMIRQAAKKAGYSERIRITPETGYDWDEMYSLLYANSLFAEKRLIEFDFKQTLPPKDASSVLSEYATKPSENNLLLIETNKVDDKIAKSTWFNAVEKNGASLALWPIPREQMPQWIMNRAKRYKMQFNLDAAVLLTEYVEGNLIAAAQVIEKAYLLKPTDAIDIELLNLILVDESRFSIFDFVENVIAGNSVRALHILDNLKLEGADPILVLWGITRELRLLSDLSVEHKNGSSYETLFQKHRIFARRQPALKRFLGTQTSKDCLGYLMQAANIDKMLKGAANGNPWDALQMFCLRLK